MTGALTRTIDTGTHLVRYEAACRALAEARSVDEVKDIRDQAMAMKLYARQARNKELEADAAAIRLQAERRLGEMMAAQPKAKGGGDGSNQHGKSNRVSEKPGSLPATLAEAGIDKNLASRARTLAALSDEKFEQVVADTRDAGTRAVKSVVRVVELEQERAAVQPRVEHGGTVADLAALAASGKRFSVIYADPPWGFQCWDGKDKRVASRGSVTPYDTMEMADIAALPIADLALPDCALFLWAVWPTMPEAFGIIESWGFEYKTCGFSWTKAPSDRESYTEDDIYVGLGYWTRANNESCLLATRGNPKRLNADVRQAIIEPRRDHSRKPDCVRHRIERLVAGPYLELFARSERPGWTVWGNEIAREAATKHEFAGD
jgi:N6-adenosine-specific RNA methylase IME4